MQMHYMVGCPVLFQLHFLVFCNFSIALISGRQVLLYDFEFLFVELVVIYLIKRGAVCYILGLAFVYSLNLAQQVHVIEILAIEMKLVAINMLETSSEPFLCCS